MGLLTRVDDRGNEIPYTEAELLRYQARVTRVRGEVAEIRAAAESLRGAGGAFHDQVADFLECEARLLERANEADGSVELRWQDDTRQTRDYAPTSARRALLIARAWTTDRRG